MRVSIPTQYYCLIKLYHTESYLLILIVLVFSAVLLFPTMTRQALKLFATKTIFVTAGIKNCIDFSNSCLKKSSHLNKSKIYFLKS